MHVLIEPAINGAVYGLLFGTLLGYFLEVNYGYFSERKYQAYKQASKSAGETQLSGWIDRLEDEVTAEPPPVNRDVGLAIEDLIREAEQQFPHSRLSIVQARI